MGIEVKITAESTSDLHEQMAALLAGAAVNFSVQETTQLGIARDIEAIGEGAEEAAATPAPKPRGRKKADKEPAERNVSTGSTAESTPSVGTASTTTEAGPSNQEDEPQVVYEDVRKAVVALSLAKGRDATVKVLSQFGVDHATKLKPEQWVDAVAELNAAMEVA